MSRHAIQRAADRYGLTLTFEDLGEIARIVQSGQAKLIKVEACGRTHVWVQYRDTPLKVIMSADEKAVVTFLPPFSKSYKAMVRGQRHKERKRQRQATRYYARGEMRYGEPG